MSVPSFAKLYLLHSSDAPPGDDDYEEDVASPKETITPSKALTLPKPPNVRTEEVEKANTNKKPDKSSNDTPQTPLEADNKSTTGIAKAKTKETTGKVGKACNAPGDDNFKDSRKAKKSDEATKDQSNTLCPGTLKAPSQKRQENSAKTLVDSSEGVKETSKNADKLSGTGETSQAKTAFIKPTVRKESTPATSSSSPVRATTSRWTPANSGPQGPSGNPPNFPAPNRMRHPFPNRDYPQFHGRTRPPPFRGGRMRPPFSERMRPPFPERMRPPFPRRMGPANFGPRMEWYPPEEEMGYYDCGVGPPFEHEMECPYEETEFPYEQGGHPYGMGSSYQSETGNFERVEHQEGRGHSYGEIGQSNQDEMGVSTINQSTPNIPQAYPSNTTSYSEFQPSMMPSGNIATYSPGSTAFANHSIPGYQVNQEMTNTSGADFSKPPPNLAATAAFTPNQTYYSAPTSAYTGYSMPVTATTASDVAYPYVSTVNTTPQGFQPPMTLSTASNQWTSPAVSASQVVQSSQLVQTSQVIPVPQMVPAPHIVQPPLPAPTVPPPLPPTPSLADLPPLPPPQMVPPPLVPPQMVPPPQKPSVSIAKTAHTLGFSVQSSNLSASGTKQQQSQGPVLKADPPIYGLSDSDSSTSSDDDIKLLKKSHVEKVKCENKDSLIKERTDEKTEECPPKLTIASMSEAKAAFLAELEKKMQPLMSRSQEEKPQKVNVKPVTSVFGSKELAKKRMEAFKQTTLGLLSKANAEAKKPLKAEHEEKADSEESKLARRAAGTNLKSIMDYELSLKEELERKRIQHDMSGVQQPFEKEKILPKSEERTSSKDISKEEKSDRGEFFYKRDKISRSKEEKEESSSRHKEDRHKRDEREDRYRKERDDRYRRDRDDRHREDRHREDRYHEEKRRRERRYSDDKYEDSRRDKEGRDRHQRSDSKRDREDGRRERSDREDRYRHRRDKESKESYDRDDKERRDGQEKEKRQRKKDVEEKRREQEEKERRERKEKENEHRRREQEERERREQEEREQREQEEREQREQEEKEQREQEEKEQREQEEKEQREQEEREQREQEERQRREQEEVERYEQVERERREQKERQKRHREDSASESGTVDAGVEKLNEEYLLQILREKMESLSAAQQHSSVNTVDEQSIGEETSDSSEEERKARKKAKKKKKKHKLSSKRKKKKEETPEDERYSKGVMLMKKMLTVATVDSHGERGRSKDSSQERDSSSSRLESKTKKKKSKKKKRHISDSSSSESLPQRSSKKSKKKRDKSSSTSSDSESLRKQKSKKKRKHSEVGIEQKTADSNTEMTVEEQMELLAMLLQQAKEKELAK